MISQKKELYNIVFYNIDIFVHTFKPSVIKRYLMMVFYCIILDLILPIYDLLQHSLRLLKMYFIVKNNAVL